MTNEAHNIASRPKLRIFSNLPRSGGTLISRCLGCMDDIVLLSEISPVSGQVQPELGAMYQATHWHQLMAADDWPPQPSFAQVIDLIYQRVQQLGRHLIVRDWAYIDYMAVPYFPAPPAAPLLPQALNQTYDLCVVQLVRHPIDQWLSICQGRILKKHLSVAQYLHGYRCYLNDGCKSRRIYYEKFLASPEEQMQRLCHLLQVDYQADFINRWYRYQWITGDRFQGSTSFSQQSIRPNAQRPIPRDLYLQFTTNEDYQAIVSELAYPEIDARRQ